MTIAVHTTHIVKKNSPAPAGVFFFSKDMVYMWCMAIHVESQNDDVKITLNNGHYEALKNIEQSYKIKNLEETISFILAIMEKTEDNGVNIDGKTYKPSKDIVEG